MTIKLGFLGAGAITSAIVTGLNAQPDSPYSIVLSPRNAEIASELARRFPNVLIAPSNQEVVNLSDVIVIAVRPQIAHEVLPALAFRSGHTIISLVSGYPVAKLARLVHPAERISRAVPLPSAARRHCPTPIYPYDAESDRLFSLLGAAIVANTEHEFDVWCAATATMATYFAFADCISGWLSQNGIAEAKSRDYVARILSGLADTAIQFPNRKFPELAADHATAGGINEQLLRDLKTHGTFENLSQGLDAILQRVTAASK